MERIKTTILSVIITFLAVTLLVQAATILTTDSTDKIGVFRTNVNTSLTNLNLAITTSTSALGQISNISSSTGNLIMGSSGAWVVLTPGTSGKFLQSNGVGSALTYETVTAITSLNGSTSSTQTFATSTDTNLGVIISTTGGVHTFTPVWIGTLADGRITSSATWNAKQDAISFPIPVASSSLVAGRSLTLSTDTLDADAELYVYKAKIAFEEPTATDDFFFGEIATAVTFTSIYCKTLVGTVNLDVTIAGVDINGTDITCTTSGVLDSSLGGDTAGAVGEEVKLEITSVASAPTYLFLQINGTYND